MRFKLAATEDLAAYRAAAKLLPPQEVEIPEARQSPVRFLTTVERATIKVTAPEVAELPVGNSILHEAAVRLAVFQARDQLKHLSGYSISADLQYAVLRSRWYRTAHRGLCLLAALDESGLAEVTLDTVDPDDSRKYKRVRMTTRLAELALDTIV